MKNLIQSIFLLGAISSTYSQSSFRSESLFYDVHENNTDTLLILKKQNYLTYLPRTPNTISSGQILDHLILDNDNLFELKDASFVTEDIYNIKGDIQLRSQSVFGSIVYNSRIFDSIENFTTFKKKMFTDKNRGYCTVLSTYYVLHDIVLYAEQKQHTVIHGFIHDTTFKFTSLKLVELANNFPENHIKLSPNPAHDNTTILSNIKFNLCILYDLKGNVIKKYTFNSSLIGSILTNTIKPGVYLIKLFSDKNQLIGTSKFLKI